MVAHLAAHLARRGVEFANEHIKNPKLHRLHDIPAWGKIMMLATSLAFLFVSFTLHYTIRLVIGHLAIVEHPKTEVEVYQYEPASKEEAKVAQNLVDLGLLDEEAITQTVVETKSRPITASIRRAKRHICTIGGRESSKYRGLGIYVLYVLMTGFLGSVIRLPLLGGGLLGGGLLADVVAAIVAARIHCAWTHKIITMPSEKTLKERLVSRAQWKELVVPTIISAGANTVCLTAIPFIFDMSQRLAAALHEQGAPDWIRYAVVVPVNVLLFPALAVFLMIPAYAQLVLKELSLLPPEEQTIVPTDGTFGGRLDYLGQKLSLKDAWNSFSWEARRRLIKLYVKFFVILMAVGFVFANILGVQIYAFAGDQIADLLREMSNKGDL